jgi:hypothetical protein
MPCPSDFASALASLKARIDSGAFPEIEPACRFCDGYGNLISEVVEDGRTYSTAKPCPACAERNQARKHGAMTSCALDRFKNTIPHGLQFALDHRFVWETKARDIVGRYCGVVKVEKNRLTAEHGLIMLGSPGVGKTIAALFGITELIHRCPWTDIFHVQNFSALLDQYQHGSPEAGPSWAAQKDHTRRRITRAGLIVIDDIGRQVKYDGASRSAQQDLLFLVLSKASDDRIPCVLISNLDKDGFRQFLGSDAARSRLDAPYWAISTITGDDLRQPGMANNYSPEVTEHVLVH